MWRLVFVLADTASGEYPQVPRTQAFISMNGYSSALPHWQEPVGYAQQGRDWTGTCATGTRQSPIDINEWPANPSEYAVVTQSNSTFRPITFHNLPTTPRVSFNEMFDLYWIFSGSLKQQILDFPIEQLLGLMLFQAPAEHTINGITYPLGIILGYFEPDASGSVTLAYYLYVHVKEGARNPGLDQVLNEQPLDVSYFLPPGGVLDDYYFYSGSYEAPPCSEPLDWIIPNYVVEAAPDQIAHFQDLWINDLSFSNGRGNIRAAQPLNGRTVYHFIPEDASVSFLG